MKTSSILITEPSSDYELLDSGEGEKLERFGKVVLSRPDPQALWRKNLSPEEWKKADGNFTREEKKGEWKLAKETPAKWQIDFNKLKFWIKPTPFKHVGIFPEQAPNWEWMRERIIDASGTAVSSSPRKLASRNPTAPLARAEGTRLPSELRISDRSDSSRTFENSVPSASSIEILNLFGYTGGATLACAQAGAKVVHIDGSKASVTWARENAEISGLESAPIRWIVEDARTFVEREIRRDRKYAGIIMDPPSFGHGPDSELWKIEDDFLALVENCVKLLNDKPIFFLINGYASGYSAIAYENVLKPLVEKFGGTIEIGELAISETKTRLLPCGIFARWSR